MGTVDTTAAGDTFTGYFVACMAAGRPEEECLDLASRAAAPCRVTARRRSVYPHHGRGAALHPPARGVNHIR
ncbi:MAG: PfkB family carbohydrate kinase [Dysosmobacter sp.]